MISIAKCGAASIGGRPPVCRPARPKGPISVGDYQLARRLPGDVGELVLLGDPVEDSLDEWVGFEREGDRGIAQG